MKVEVFDVEWGEPINPIKVEGTYEIPEDVIASCKDDEERNNAAGNWLVEKLEAESGHRAMSFTWDECQ